MPIRVLPEKVASQIAAGEVVERPSSVVKELVENSIDADARDIGIEVQRGGKQLIRVVDDGGGIPQAEAELAFERHSTSKLSTAQDLNHISTLGFRGEALASIASVSRLTLVTRVAAEEVGVLLRIEGGEVVDHRSSGRPPGTTITVEDLFFNVPARLKFLRSDLTERRHIDTWVTHYAMAYPGLRLSLDHDGREKFRSPGSGKLRDVLVEVYGAEVGGSLLEIPPDSGSSDPHRVSGFVSPPSVHRSNRRAIGMFVNGRWIRDSRLTYAVVQAYHTFLPTGRYPVAVIMLELPPEEVDVNVHPAKVEVRFQDRDKVFRAIQRAVRYAVVGGAPVPSVSVGGDRPWQDRPRPLARQPAPEVGGPLLMPDLPRAAVPADSGMVPLRVVGQIKATYIVAEGPDGLYLLDQHAAHERVLYERMMAQQTGDESVGQGLLEPVAVEVSPQAAALVEENLETVGQLGLDVEPFGKNAFLVRSLPAVLTRADPAEVLLEVAAAIEGSESRVKEEIERSIVSSVCKRAAVKAGQVLTREEMEELVRALEQSANPRTCPHGRPTMIRLSVEQLAREFSRH